MKNAPIVLFGSFVQISDNEGGTAREAREPLPRGSPLRLVEPFDALVFTGDTMGHRRRCTTLPCSVALHAAAGVALIALPLLAPAELPGQAMVVAAFFVDPIVVPPPPPPPPPAAARAAVAVRPTVVPAPDATARFTAPIEVPEKLRPEEGLDLGVMGGVPGGVSGGVPGGVVGGIVGGLPDAPEYTPPPVAPLRVGGHIKEPVKTRHVPPVYPKVAMAAGVEGIVIIEAVIDEKGRIEQARLLRGVPILDEAALAAVRQWEYTPTLLDGVPTRVVMTITVTFRLKRSTGR